MPPILADDRPIRPGNEATQKVRCGTYITDLIDEIRLLGETSSLLSVELPTCTGSPGFGNLLPIGLPA
jgi:hypothetical protein